MQMSLWMKQIRCLKDNIMKQSEINQSDYLEEKELVFINMISEYDGYKGVSHTSPKDWGNIKHITGNLYYAYDDNPKSGIVYVGEFK